MPEVPLSQHLVGNRGMTLIEMILALALGCLILAGAAMAIKTMGASSDVSKLNTNIQRIVYGISEYQSISKTLPSGSSWPALLEDFVEASMRSSFSYKCDLSTGNVITITTVSAYSTDPTQKLKDQGICTNDANTAYNADMTVTCRPVSFATQVCI
jgi:prepilin-type N-terminal cleavage/methylation domain-containing protein